MAGDPLRRDETIVALATAPGRGAIALVRLSGPRAFEIASRHVRPWPARPRAVTNCEIFEGSEILDDALVTLFVGPHSFTGEDVVELSTHGGHAVPASVTAALIRSGATPALGGEFTRRAILNGKLDLVQAEGIGELVGARSSAMQRAALSQMHGGLTRKLTALREEFLRLEALIAYHDGDIEGALGFLESAKDIDSLALQAMMLVEQHRLQEAREKLSLTFAIDPNHPDSRRVAALLHIADRQPAQARLEAEKALELRPNWESIRLVVAVVDYMSGLSPQPFLMV